MLVLPEPVTPATNACRVSDRSVTRSRPAGLAPVVQDPADRAGSSPFDSAAAGDGVEARHQVDREAGRLELGQVHVGGELRRWSAASGTRTGAGRPGAGRAPGVGQRPRPAPARRPRAVEHPHRLGQRPLAREHAAPRAGQAADSCRRRRAGRRRCAMPRWPGRRRAEPRPALSSSTYCSVERAGRALVLGDRGLTARISLRICATDVADRPLRRRDRRARARPRRCRSASG